MAVCERVKPDLVITDIRMPLMDGLTMLHQIKKIIPTTRFIILSGYDEFEYARQAIAANCLGYILKPISSAEFAELLSEAKQKLDEEFAQRRDLIRLQQHFETSLPLLKGALLCSLLSDGLTREEAFEMAQRYHMPLDAGQYLVAFIRIDSLSSTQDSIKDPELLNFAVMNVAKEILEAYTPMHLFHYHGLIAVLLLLNQNEQAFSDAVAWLDEARKTIDHYLHIKASIGISAPCVRIEHLANASRQALSALDQCTLLEDRAMVCITDLEPASHSELVFSEQDQRLLSNGLKMGDTQKLEEVIAALIGECREAKPTPKMYKTFLLEIFMTLLRAARDMSVDLEMSEEHVLEALMTCPPFEQAQDTLNRICRQFAAIVKESKATSTRFIAQQALNYIALNYADEDLSLEKLCRHLHVSPSYFSVLFKKETKKTFVQHLTEQRMDKAMSLLTTSPLKTVQIAQQVGIPDPSYFSYSFKKHFGLSPAQVRRQSEGGA